MNYKLLFIFSLLLIVGCSNSVDPKYVGTHDGRWEGFLLNQYNQGSATFTVKESGNAKLVLRGKFSAVHNGYISGNYFVIKSNNEKCGIVDMGDGSFKVVLIWTGVNVDVFFP